nr:reverse transcriptase domain-containing protein [Tanacetum cinerariifolium]
RAPIIVEPEVRTIVKVAPMAKRTMEELLQASTEGDVSNDVIKLMMFPYSLEGDARVWYDKEPPNFILTWEDLIRGEFGEAWKRFKEMLRACPHHGFTKLTQIDTFYNGLNDNDQDSLNAAAGKNLFSKTTREALQIIENKLKVCYLRNKPNVFRMNTTSKENTSKTDDRIDKLADQILTLVDIFAKKVITPAPVKAVEESCTLPKPNIPYPSRLNDQKLYEKATNQMDKFFQIFQDLHFNISFVDALLLMPKFANTIKSLLTNKDKLFELAKMPLNENCSAMLFKKLPKKLGDLGKFLIPCDYSVMDVCHALADLGASINLMPLFIWKNLSLPELTPTRMTLELADRSITRPKGIAEDVFVKVGKFHFLTDFVVVDFEAVPRVPLILGRSFLRTGRDLIDVYGEAITLRVNDEAVTFNLNQTTRYSSTYDDLSVNQIDIIDVAREEYAREMLGFSKNSLGGNPTSNSEPIIFDSSPSLTSFEGSDFILEEIEAYLKDESISPEINHDCIDAFEILKKKLTEALILVISDWNLSFELMCDASDFAIGAVLGQCKTKHFQPIHYASKTMTEAQIHYTTTEKEMLVVLYAFENFQPHLILSKSIVYTDHSALKYLLSKQDAKPRLIQRVLLLQEFDIIIRDKKGTKNLTADHLSRLEYPHKKVFENKDINENFPLETLGKKFSGTTPWFADFANFHARNFIVKGMSSQQKKKFFNMCGSNHSTVCAWQRSL